MARNANLKISSYLFVDKGDSTDSPRPSVEPREALQWILVFGLSALLIFGVLSFGAVEEWSTFTFEAGAAALFLIWAAKQLVSNEIRLSKNPLYLPALLFGGLLLAQIGLRKSAYEYATKYEALQYISYGIALLIAAGSGTDGEWQDLLDSQCTLSRCDLRELCQPRSLCRTHGDASSDSVGAQPRAYR